jgi:hypothetical protein
MTLKVVIKIERFKRFKKLLQGKSRLQEGNT